MRSFAGARGADVPGLIGSVARGCLAVSLCLALLGCLGQGGARKVTEVPAVDEENAQLQVYPLHNPAVANLMERATGLREQGNIDAAIVLIEQALELAPRNPLVLQEMAELQLLDGDFRMANRLARESWVLGPRVGPLCERNWHTIALAAPRIGDQQGALEAAAELPRCAAAAVPH